MSEKPEKCKECGGGCRPDDCGVHPKGCVFGGPDHAPYWLVVQDCDLEHE